MKKTTLKIKKPKQSNSEEKKLKETISKMKREVANLIGYTKLFGLKNISKDYVKHVGAMYGLCIEAAHICVSFNALIEKLEKIKERNDGRE